MRNLLHVDDPRSVINKAIAKLGEAGLINVSQSWFSLAKRCSVLTSLFVESIYWKVIEGIPGRFIRRRSVRRVALLSHRLRKYSKT